MCLDQMQHTLDSLSTITWPQITDDVKVILRKAKWSIAQLMIHWSQRPSGYLMLYPMDVHYGAH